MRVGWKNVIIKRDAPDYFAKSIQSISNMVVFSPRYELINGQRINTATLIMPDFKANLLDKIISNGSKELFSAVKKHLENKSALDKVEAFIIALRTEIYYVTINDDRRLYNSAYYCHVFSNFCDGEFCSFWNVSIAMASHFYLIISIFQIQVQLIY